MEEDIIVKICILGESGVGKTSMLYQYVFKKFDPDSRPTIGCDFSTKMKSTSDGKPLRLQLWDIAGQERFNAVSKMYIRGALGCIIVCSATDEASLKQTLRWKKVVDENCDRTGGQFSVIPALLVQNKIDLISPEEPEDYQTKQHLQQFAKNNGFYGVCCTSAKDNINIDTCFQSLLDEIVKRQLIKYPVSGDDEKEEEGVHKLTLSQPKSIQKSSGCC